MRNALEERLKQVAKTENQDIMRLRRQVAFDRFLARLFNGDRSDLFVLKGGYSLELRLKKARTTKDIDICIHDTSGLVDSGEEPVRQLIQQQAEEDLGDFFYYTVGEAILDLENAPYGGYRFPVECTMAGRRFAHFSIDIAAGDAWIVPHDTIELHHWLNFAGIAAATVLTISPEQQFAEKLHSYTMPRETPNSRVKDLVDMVLLINNTKMNADTLQNAVLKTFQRRKTHEIPLSLQNPPDSWSTQLKKMSEECGMPVEVDTAIDIVRSFCLANSILVKNI